MGSVTLLTLLVSPRGQALLLTIRRPSQQEAERQPSRTGRGLRMTGSWRCIDMYMCFWYILRYCCWICREDHCQYWSPSQSVKAFMVSVHKQDSWPSQQSDHLQLCPKYRLGQRAALSHPRSGRHREVTPVPGEVTSWASQDVAASPRQQQLTQVGGTKTAVGMGRLQPPTQQRFSHSWPQKRRLRPISRHYQLPRRG